MNIKIRQEDKLFSQYIRTRDRKCVNCKTWVVFNEEGNPLTHQCSHYWSRRNEGTRFDPLNCDTLCFSCHQKWGGDYRDEYTAFKKKQLGEKGYNDLRLRAHLYYKKDRKLALMYVKELLKTLVNH